MMYFNHAESFRDICHRSTTYTQIDSSATCLHNCPYLTNDRLAIAYH